MNHATSSIPSSSATVTQASSSELSSPNLASMRSWASMGNSMSSRQRSQATTTRVEEPSGGAQLDARVLGWTVLYHPELARVGERALLTGLEAGRAFELSRSQPLFGAPGRAAERSLDDARISRAPQALGSARRK